MSRPQNPRLRKTAFHVAARVHAVRAVREAFPDMTSAAIASALGVSRHAVRHYLLEGAKMAEPRPDWADDFFAAARQLCTTQPARAAEPLARLARRLAQKEAA